MSDDLGPVPRALTIAGSDSGGGAGIQADLKTFAAYGVYGASAVTAVTAQDTQGVRDQLAMPATLVEAQIDAVLGDIGADAVKTGMLATAGIARAVAEKLREHGVAQLVVDPVMVATSGDRLLERDALEALIQALLPLAAVVTPNVREAEAITGRGIATWDDARGAAAQIVEMGARAVVITGGDFAAGRQAATDLFYDGRGYREFTAVRVETTSTHGTGCTFSAAIAAGLAKGLGLADAVALGKSYVTLAIQHAYPVGGGRGPVHHFYRYWQPTGRRYRPGVAPR
ncbi:MAG TPA: bifunctional hydroxymethylpyrimidine kinase/phosphomethylpyrimidine kinase [Dehalococcoidia bacterium]|nr:bifunctional hydroxymethylpyrimidine kinase/phosphomethylpyrimidine kinase [Dehalococcoidia bacterium]